MIHFNKQPLEIEWGGPVGSAIGAAANLANTGLQIWAEKKRQEQQAEYNRQAAEQAQKYNEKNMMLSYQYGEDAANAADARTRALYKDLYGTEAQVQQLKDAGLSVGLMYGGSGPTGVSTPSGAQGSGSAPLATHVQPTNAINPIQGMQMELTWAQIQKTLAEAKNLNADTDKTKGTTPLIMENLKLQGKELTESIANLQQDIKNKEAQEELTKVTTSYTKVQESLTSLEVDFNEMTFNNRIGQITADLQTAVTAWDNLKINRDINLETKEAQIKQVQETLNQTIAQTALMKMQEALENEKITLTKEQVKQLQQWCTESVSKIGMLDSQKARNEFLNEFEQNKWDLEKIYRGIEVGAGTLESLGKAFSDVVGSIYGIGGIKGVAAATKKK